ncbi:MAG TPA: GNAT family N-acetyltransferase [Longimicrobiaceae bacterium]|nr:GNAT family N-acetyltransferase [Longimicrobiaceae bacterium]
MHGTTLRTDRLELVGCSAELLRAEGDDRARFAELLRARVPPAWPPELYDDDARRFALRMVTEAPDDEGWWFYYVVRVPEEGGAGREVVGTMGYKGRPSDDGTVEVGYSVIADHRRRGYATEALAALLERAFAFPQVARVIAETYPELEPSIGVLEKSGFAFVGEGSEERVIRFELPRDRWEAR